MGLTLYRDYNSIEFLNPVWGPVRILPPQSLRVVRGDEGADDMAMYGYWSSVTGLDM
jgi:hypothetical protein